MISRLTNYRYPLIMQAALYQTEFRPVPLEEYIKVGSSIYNKKMELIRTIPRTADLGGKDPDHVVELCNEVHLLCAYSSPSALITEILFTALTDSFD